MTVITYVLVSVYLYTKVVAFYDKSDQVENKSEIKVDLFEEDTIYMNQTNMQLVVLTTEIIPKEIGSWKARRIYKRPGNITGMLTEDYPIEDCANI